MGPGTSANTRRSTSENTCCLDWQITRGPSSGTSEGTGSREEVQRARSGGSVTDCNSRDIRSDRAISGLSSSSSSCSGEERRETREEERQKRGEDTHHRVCVGWWWGGLGFLWTLSRSRPRFAYTGGTRLGVCDLKSYFGVQPSRWLAGERETRAVGGKETSVRCGGSDTRGGGGRRCTVDRERGSEDGDKLVYFIVRVAGRRTRAPAREHRERQPHLARSEPSGQPRRIDTSPICQVVRDTWACAHNNIV